MLEEAFWFECARVGEEGGIVVDEDGGHADRGHGWDGNVFVLEYCVREEALETVGDAVADTEGLGDDGGEVGQLF